MTRRRMPVPSILAVVALVAAACATPGTTSTDVGDPDFASASPAPSVGASAAASVVAPSDAVPSEAPPSEAPATEEVRLTLSNFEPEQLTIAVGTTIIFINDATFDHTVTEGTGGQAADDPLIDEVLEPEARTELTFDRPGTYELTCLFHPTMAFIVTVTG